jgi:hypothetical protein
VGIVSRSQGGSGGLGAVLFDSTLGANTATIDTGAGGIAQTATSLKIEVIARTNDAGANALLNVLFNNDSTAGHYDGEKDSASAAVASASNHSVAAALLLRVHGAGGSASYPSAAIIEIPFYRDTTFFKVGTAVNATPDATAGNALMDVWTWGWQSTAAITRVSVSAQGGALMLAGSRMRILGF